MTLFSVKMSPTVECSSRRLLHNLLCFPFQTWLTCLVTRWRGGASVDTSTCFHSPFLLLRTPHCSNITARRIQVLPHKGMPLTAASTFTTQHNQQLPPKMRPTPMPTWSITVMHRHKKGTLTVQPAYHSSASSSSDFYNWYCHVYGSAAIKKYPEKFGCASPNICRPFAHLVLSFLLMPLCERYLECKSRIHCLM